MSKESKPHRPFNINEKQAVFNGHTWIVVIIAILCLFILGVGAMAGLFYLILNSNEAEAIKTLEGVGIPAIPYIVVKGIIDIVDRLTYLPKEE